MFKKLKQIGQAMSPDAIRQGWAASMEAMANGGQLTPEQRAAMTPEQLAAYDQAMDQMKAQMQAGADTAIADAEAQRALLGEAGDHLHGPLPDREQLTDLRPGAQMGHAAQGFKDALRDTFRGGIGGAPTPPPPAPPVSSSPAEQAAHELARREEARTPYLAQTRSPIVFTRIATDRKKSVEGLCTWLGTSGLAGRPDLVYGVARVPDHVPGTFGIGKPALVEWDIVHAATEPLPPVAAAEVASFDARVRWVARRPGEPSVLDEDLGVELFRQADLGPEQCLGVAREIAVDADSGDEESRSSIIIGVTGVLALHPAGAAPGVFERMQASAPMPMASTPEVHVVVLNWEAIRNVVMPRADKRPVVPSPFPHLPLTGGELLASYLAIVGIAPSDCYSAQVTEEQPEDIIGGTVHTTTTFSDKEPAADGEMRRRFRGGARVVVAYRDNPVYAAGRERWAAYERDVLQSQLHVGVTARGPVPAQSAFDKGALGATLRGAEAVGSFFSDSFGRRSSFAKVPYHRYCWPPVA